MGIIKLFVVPFLLGALQVWWFEDDIKLDPRRNFQKRFAYFIAFSLFWSIYVAIALVIYKWPWLLLAILVWLMTEAIDWR